MRNASTIARFIVALVLATTAGRADVPAPGPGVIPPPRPDEAPPNMERVTLAQAVQRAEARNVNIVVAVEEIRRAEALVREARASSLPTLTGNAVYTRLDADR